MGKYIFLSFKFVQVYPNFLGQVSTFNVMRLSGAEMMGCQIIHIMQHFKNLRPVGEDDKLQRRAGVDVLAHLGSETEFGSVQSPVMQFYVSILLIPYLSTTILPIPISQQQLAINILFSNFQQHHGKRQTVFIDDTEFLQTMGLQSF